jgi:3-oxoacyl-(acyl-carrier-protein) synthase
MAGDLRAVLGRHENQPFSKSGVARPFDKNADGSLVGEGAAAVILKRLDDAKQDGDHIYAVIKGVGTATGAKPGRLRNQSVTWKPMAAGWRLRMSLRRKP